MVILADSQVALAAQRDQVSLVELEVRPAEGHNSGTVVGALEWATASQLFETDNLDWLVHALLIGRWSLQLPIFFAWQHFWQVADVVNG